MKTLLAAGAANAATVHCRRWLMLGASVLIAACASKPPTEGAQSAEAGAQQLVASDVDIVCRDVTVTGSHFPKRVCRTKKEWGQIEDASRGFTQGLQSDSTRNLAPAALPNGGINPTPVGGAPVY